MPLPVVEVKYEGQELYSPYSGKRVETANGPNTRDSTLLFVHYGDACDYAYINNRVRKILETKRLKNLEQLSPATLAKRLDIEGGFVLRVDAGWNGINQYGFAPPPQKG